MCWWCVLVACWWRVGGESAVCLWCVGGVLVVCVVVCVVARVCGVFLWGVCVCVTL